MPSIPEDELIEKLAAIEHDRWADWQKWVHGMLKVNSAGEYVLPADAIRRWDRQIETPYSELTEKEKQSDRDQVMRYWPLVRQYAAKEAAKALENGVGVIYGIANDLANQDPKAIGAVSTAPYFANAVAIYSEFLKGDNYERIDWKALKLPTLEASNNLRRVCDDRD